MIYCSGTKHAQRNRLAVLLSHSAGLRVGEIASLTWDQVVDANDDLREQFFLDAANTKAKEARLVHVNVKLMAELATAQNLTKSRTGADVTGPIIASQRGGHFGANSSLAQVFERLTLTIF